MASTLRRALIERAGRAEITHGPWLSVSSATARIAFRTSERCAVAVRYAANATLAAPTTSAATTVTDASDCTGTVDLSGLTADAVYTFRFVVDGREVADPWGYSTFRTFPAAGDVSFSFGFGSCAGFTSSTVITRDFTYKQLLTTGARFFLHLGDTIYADDDAPTTTTLAGYRTHHRRALTDGNLFTFNTVRSLRSLPLFTIWDDHEIANDWAGGQAGIYLSAEQAWNEYHGRANPDPRTANQHYYAFSYGNVGFYVLDQRSYRSAIAATDNASKTLLGATQLADLESWLLANNATYKLKVICSPTIVSGYAANTGGDSWGGVDDGFQVPTGANGYRTERNALLDYIATNNISGVLFISGDQHWAGAFKFAAGTEGRSYYELMSSPMQRSVLSPPARAADAVNGPIFWKYNGSANFGLVTLDTTVADPTIAYQLYGINGSLGAGNLTSLTKSQLDVGL